MILDDCLIWIVHCKDQGDNKIKKFKNRLQTFVETIQKSNSMLIETIALSEEIKNKPRNYSTWLSKKLKEIAEL